MLAITKWVKMIVLDFQGYSYYAQNGGKWVAFGSKINSLNFSLNLLCRFFWNCTNYRHRKVGKRGSFGFRIFCPKLVIFFVQSQRLKFSLNLFIRFLLNYTFTFQKIFGLRKMVSYFIKHPRKPARKSKPKSLV